MPTDVTGLGTFAQLPEQDRSLISNQYQVPVYRGDEMLPDNLPGATFIKTEKILDILYKQIKEKIHKKPRTYRNLARKDYLLIAKQRRPTRNKRRQAIKKQLQYIKRNLAHIEQLIDAGASLEDLTKKQYKTLLVLTEVTRFPTVVI